MKNTESEVLEMNVENQTNSQSGDERLNQLINGSVAVLRSGGEGMYFATVGNHRITELHDNIEDVEKAVTNSVMIVNRSLIAITEILLKKQEDLETLIKEEIGECKSGIDYINKEIIKHTETIEKDILKIRKKLPVEFIDNKN